MGSIDGWILAIAIAIAGGWYAHHEVYDHGYNAGVVAQKKADDKALNDDADANAAMARTLGAAESAAADLAKQLDTTKADAAKAAAFAKSERDKIAAQAAKSNKALSSLMAGECRDWSKEPACGSMEGSP